MKRRGPIALLIFLGIPSLAIILFVILAPGLSCEINPWAGYTCPRAYGGLLILAALGAFTIVPFVLISSIWCIMTALIWGAEKRQGPKTRRD